MTTTILPQFGTILSKCRSLKILVSQPGLIDASRAYIIDIITDIGEPTPTKIKVNLPDTI
ncbi:MAG: hypothetical protein ABI180_01955 [Microcoleus sp.]